MLPPPQKIHTNKLFCSGGGIFARMLGGSIQLFKRNMVWGSVSHFLFFLFQSRSHSQVKGLILGLIQDLTMVYTCLEGKSVLSQCRYCEPQSHQIFEAMQAQVTIWMGIQPPRKSRVVGQSQAMGKPPLAFLFAL